LFQKTAENVVQKRAADGPKLRMKQEIRSRDFSIRVGDTGKENPLRNYNGEESSTVSKSVIKLSRTKDYRSRQKKVMTVRGRSLNLMSGSVGLRG
jgi:hypothetical protein